MVRERADALADQFEQINQNVIDMVSTATDLSVACPGEGWTAAAVGAHIGGAHRGILEGLIQPLSRGGKFPPWSARLMKGTPGKRRRTPRCHGIRSSRYCATTARWLPPTCEASPMRISTVPSFSPSSVRTR